MPQHYERKTNTDYSEDELLARIEFYRSSVGTRGEISISAACKFDEDRKILVGAFWNRLHGVHQKRFGSGRMTVLTKDKEEYLVFGLECMADYDWGAGTDTLQEIVKNFMELIGREV